MESDDLKVNEELKKLLFSCITDIKELKKNDYLYHMGDTAENLYFIINGFIKNTLITADGKEITLNIFKDNDYLGELSLFHNNIKNETNAIALSSAKVGAIKKNMIEDIILKNSNLMIRYVQWTGLMQSIYKYKLRDNLLYGKKGALYSSLIRAANVYGKNTANGITINIKLTSVEFGKIAGGLSRESANKMLNDLIDEKIISIKNSCITIHNIDFLRSYIKCEHCDKSICQL